MSTEFDPYHRWLAIRDPERPPNHYRLLGLEPFEDDPDVIENAADARMSHVRTYQTGRHSEWSQRILNELTVAKLCLLNAKKKRAYDEQLGTPAATVTTGAGNDAPTLDFQIDTGDDQGFAASVAPGYGSAAALPAWFWPAAGGTGLLLMLLAAVVVVLQLSGDPEDLAQIEENASQRSVRTTSLDPPAGTVPDRPRTKVTRPPQVPLVTPEDSDDPPKQNPPPRKKGIFSGLKKLAERRNILDQPQDGLVQRCKGIERGVSDIRLSAAGDKVAALAGDGRLYVWNLASGTRERVTNLARGASGIGRKSGVFVPHAQQAVLAPFGNWPALWSGDGKLRDFADGEERVNIGRLTISAEGSRLAVVAHFPQQGRRGVVLVWDVPTGKLLRRMEPDAPVFALDFAPAGRSLATVSSGERMVRIWDLDSSSETSRELPLPGNSMAVCYLPDGSGVVTVALDGTGSLLPLDGRAEVRFACGQGTMHLAISPDGRWLVSGSSRGVLQWHQVSTGRRVAARDAHISILQSVRFSSDGRYVLSGAADQTVAVWDLAKIAPQ